MCVARHLSRSKLALLAISLSLPSAIARAEAPPADPAPTPADEPAPANPDPDPEPVPEPVPEPAPAPEPATEPEPVPAPAPVPAPEPAPAPVPATEPATEPEPKPAFSIEGAPGDGLTVKVKDAFSLNIKSRFVTRYQLNIPAPGDGSLSQTVNIATMRLWLGGHIFTPNLTYRLQLAFAGRDYRDGATSPIFDAYLDWKAHRDIGLRIGQYFVPFDRLRTVREWALQMADRPIPVQELTLDRDVGLTAYSDNFLGDKSPFAWRVGVFGGGGTNLTSGKKPGALVVTRLEVRPLGSIDDDIEGDLTRRKKPAIALGVAGAANFNSNRLRSTTGATFAGGETHHYHAAADVVFKVRGFALQGEYLYKRAADDEIVSVDEEGEPLIEPTRSGHGWIGQASYVFAVPVELVARMTGIYAFRGTDPAFVEDARARGQEVAAGLNYYFNGHKMKLQLDWISRMPHDFSFDRAEHVVHAQLDVTF